MGKPRPKYIANRAYRVGRHSFDVGDPVPDGRALDLGIRFGFVDNTAKSSTPKPDTADTPTPETADTQEKTS